MSNSFLPDINSTDREFRAKSRELLSHSDAQVVEIRKLKEQLKLDQDEFQRKANFKAAMLFIKLKNPGAKVGATKFHGIAEASREFGFTEKDLRKEVTSRFNSSTDYIPTTAVENPAIDEDMNMKNLFVKFVDLVISGDIKSAEGYRQFTAALPIGYDAPSFMVWRRAVDRRKLISPGDYFVQRGRGDRIPTKLIEELASSKQEDRAGTRKSKIYVLFLRNILTFIYFTGNSSERISDGSRNKVNLL
jgi:hypothetical protein